MLTRARDLLICAAMVVLILYGGQLWVESNFLAKLRLEQRALVAEKALGECGQR